MEQNLIDILRRKQCPRSMMARFGSPSAATTFG
jgi:hypothetical protein